MDTGIDRSNNTEVYLALNQAFRDGFFLDFFRKCFYDFCGGPRTTTIERKSFSVVTRNPFHRIMLAVDLKPILPEKLHSLIDGASILLHRHQTEVAPSGIPTLDVLLPWDLFYAAPVKGRMMIQTGTASGKGVESTIVTPGSSYSLLAGNPHTITPLDKDVLTVCVASKAKLEVQGGATLRKLSDWDLRDMVWAYCDSFGIG